MFYLLEDNRIVVDSKRFPDIYRYENRKGFLYKVFEDKNYGKNRKIGYIKKQSENVYDLIEKRDLVKYYNNIYEVKSFDIKDRVVYMDTSLGICFPSVTRFMELLDAIYKPDEKGNYIKVWEKK